MTTLLILPRIADLYGRMPVWRVGLVIQLIAFSVLMWTNNLTVMIVTIGVIGATSTARVQLGYLVLVENLPSAKHALVGSALFMGETSIGAGGAIYFTFISKNWFWFALIGYVAECWATFGSFVMSETPKYLMKSGRKQEFLTLLNRIAKWNRTNNLADETFNDLDNFRVQA